MIIHRHSVYWLENMKMLIIKLIQRMVSLFLTDQSLPLLLRAKKQIRLLQVLNLTRPVHITINV